MVPRCIAISVDHALESNSLLSGIPTCYSAESLLLGSLLWFLGIMCLFTLPVSPRLTVSPGNAGRRELQTCALTGPRNEKFRHLSLESFVMSRRCKASRSKMKPGILVPQVRWTCHLWKSHSTRRELADADALIFLSFFSLILNVGWAVQCRPICTESYVMEYNLPPSLSCLLLLVFQCSFS